MTRNATALMMAHRCSFTIAAGALKDLGTGRHFTVNTHGQLTQVKDGTTTRADYSFDAMGRVARVVEAPGASQVRRHPVTDDFEWNETAQRARIHVRLEGRIIATRCGSLCGWTT